MPNFKRKEETPEEFKERAGGYDLPPDADMSGHGWRKSKTYKYLTIQEDGKIRCEEYDFYVQDIKHECGSTKYLWLSAQRSTMILVCTWCKTTEPIGRDFARKRKEYLVSVAEAIAIMESKGYRRSDMPMRPYLKLLRASKPSDLIKRERPKD